MKLEVVPSSVFLSFVISPFMSHFFFCGSWIQIGSLTLKTSADFLPLLLASLSILRFRIAIPSSVPKCISQQDLTTCEKSLRRGTLPCWGSGIVCVITALLYKVFINFANFELKICFNLSLLIRVIIAIIKNTQIYLLHPCQTFRFLLHQSLNLSFFKSSFILKLLLIDKCLS